MSETYDGYYDNIVPVDVHVAEEKARPDVLKKAVYLVIGLVVFVIAIITVSMLI